MKRVLLGLVVVSGILTAVVVYERLFVQRTFGPSAILAVAIVGFAFLSFAITYALYDTRHRELAGKVWLAAIATIGSYVALDLIAGFFLIQPLSPALVPDHYRHHKLVPNSHSRIHTRDFSYVQRVNNVGLRGDDVSIEKPSDTHRILMLGDSFTMGKGVEDDETFAELLEQALNRKLAACRGKKVELLNAGVDSYSPLLSLIQLRKELHALKPDMIVLNLDVSDLVQEAVYRRQAVRDSSGEIVAVPGRAHDTSLTDKIRAWTDRRLFFTRAMLYYVNELFEYRDLAERNVLSQADAEIAAHTLEHDKVQRDDQWRDIFDSLNDTRSFADANGMTFLLSVYPWPHQVNDTEWVPGRFTFVPRGAAVSDRSLHTIHKLALENDIPIVDLFPVFRNHRGGGALYFRNDPHWTQEGHKVMARGLEQYFSNEYLDSWCNSR